MSNIEWTDETWNPVTGCSRVSAGCDHCYAMRFAHRLLDGQGKGYDGTTRDTKRGADWTGVVHLMEDRLEDPLRWRKPRLVFVNSMSDLFHPRVPLPFIQRVFGVMREADRHTFQVLTKRSGRILELSSVLDWPENVWMGVSVEDERVTHRIGDLARTGAFVKFLSLEPLIGPLPELNLAGIDWVIAGGESGHGARPMHPEWVRSIRNQCIEDDTAFFFKQWGAWSPHADEGRKHAFEDGTVVRRVGKGQAGRVLDGRTWDQKPGPLGAGASN